MLGILNQHVPPDLSVIKERRSERIQRYSEGLHLVGQNRIKITSTTPNIKYPYIGFEIIVRSDIDENNLLTLCEQILISSCENEGGKVRKIPLLSPSPIDSGPGHNNDQSNNDNNNNNNNNNNNKKSLYK